MKEVEFCFVFTFKEGNEAKKRLRPVLWNSVGDRKYVSKMIAMFMMIIFKAVGVKHRLSTHQSLRKWFSTIDTKWNYLCSLDPPANILRICREQSPRPTFWKGSLCEFCHYEGLKPLCHRHEEHCRSPGRRKFQGGNGLASEAAQRCSNNEDGKTSFELEGTFVTLVRRGIVGHGSKSQIIKHCLPYTQSALNRYLRNHKLDRWMEDEEVGMEYRL